MAILSFQSRAGFSPRCDTRRSGLRRLSQSRFNPVLGFLLAATAANTFLRCCCSFQSRAGFSPRCDVVGVVSHVGVLFVSIPCWVFSSLRPGTDVWATEYNQVSIPCWVFSSLRREGRGSTHERQQVSIPCWVFSSLRRFAPPMNVAFLIVFQSRAGFSPRCDVRSPRPRRAVRRFQSRAGFSPRCDVISPAKRTPTPCS